MSSKPGDSTEESAEHTDAGEVDLGVEVTKGVVAKFVQAILGFAGIIIFARILGPVGLGGFYLLLSLVQVVDWPTSGYALATKKRFSESHTAREEIVGAVFSFNILYFVLIAAAAMLLRGWLVSYTGVDEAPLLFLAMFGAMILFYPFQRLLVVKGLIALQVWNDTLRSLLTLGFQLLLVGVFGLGVWGMAIGWTTSTLAVVPIIFYFLQTEVALPTRETLHSIWTFARYSIVTAVLGKAYSRYDVLLLGFLIGPGAVGYYEAAFKLVIPASFVSSILGSGLMPKVSNLASRGEELAEEVTNGISFAAILAIPIFFGAVVLSKPIILTVYGPGFREAGVLLVGLALYQVFDSLGKTLTQVVSGLNLPDWNTRISAATLVFNIVTGYLLVLRVGAVGVVIATVLAEFARYAASVVVVKRHVNGVNVLPKVLRSQVIAGLGMYFVVWAIARSLAIDSWIRLSGIVGAGAVAYFVLLMAISPQFRHTVHSILSRMVSDRPDVG